MPLINHDWLTLVQTTPVVAGLVIGAGAYAAKFALEAAMKVRASSGPNLRAFYKVSMQWDPHQGLSSVADYDTLLALPLVMGE